MTTKQTASVQLGSPAVTGDPFFSKGNEMAKAATRQNTETGSNTNKALLDYVQRFELLNVAKENLSDDFKELARQAKGEGFDVATIKELVKVRKNEEKARERAQLLSTYASAIQIELF